MSSIKNHHDHLTRHSDAIRPGICPALKRLLFHMSKNGQKLFYILGGNGMSIPTAPLNPCQGLSEGQSFVHLPPYSSWAPGHPSTAPAGSGGPDSACCTPASATLRFFSLFPAVALSLFTGAGTGCCDNKVCAATLQSPSQISK